ncbi:C-terminal processing peptidase [Myroides odoratimimus]|uniref:aspartyl protease family protein n=1 Tax=Myroides odoratimimus TaxID=76832 RepID=UPI0009BFE683|nr:aspartyl protease family protein [Myroides odoratimimus]MDM1537115.1 aspartyl protease family protein [Myroides odoratimimus]MDM1676667.1 aspartyl protease family protein [Myroides odoratimimus]MDX4974901.1 PDZ domain-containing protein [Myroides odoratimimus]STZ48634.1 C-terminal processing peptidase [Myroides odoratimimus]
MKFHIRIISFCVVLFLLGMYFSYGQSITRLMNSTVLQESNFKTTIKFETIGKHIIVKPIIDGEEYTMLFDTGAVTAFIPSVAQKLNLKSINKVKVLDIDINSQELEYVKLDTLTLGGINFMNIGAVILDHNKVVDFKCMKFDGFLGANVFRKAIWEIDYQKKEITFTDNITNLDIPKNTAKSKMYIGYGGVPSVTSFIGKIKVYNNTIDYGYGGSISLDYSLFNKIIEKDPDVKYAYGSGMSTVGIYGDVMIPHFYNIPIESFRIGNLEIQNNVIDFGLRTRAIGVGKLSEYKVIMDWKGKSIYFIPQKEDKKTSDFEGHGYGIMLKENKVYISSLYKNSPADRAGLQKGDRILKINDRDYTFITDDQWCEISTVPRVKKQEISIIRDNGTIIEVIIERESLLTNTKK